MSGAQDAAALVWCPFPDASVAEAVAIELLDERLVACANILPPVRSLFVWKGERSQAEETAVLFKTDAAQLDRAVSRLAELHPYDCPAIAGWRCDAAPGPMLDWLREVTR